MKFDNNFLVNFKFSFFFILLLFGNNEIGVLIKIFSCENINNKCFFFDKLSEFHLHSLKKKCFLSSSEYLYYKKYFRR